MIKQKKIFLAVMAGLVTVVLFLGSCSKNKCKDQFCMNGGACVEGTCECAAGYFGDHCESKFGYNCKNGNCVIADDDGDFPTLAKCNENCGKGYVCLQGVCTYTTANATYATSSECEQSCLPVTGYKCINGVCTYTNLNATYRTESECENSCGSRITFVNKSFASMQIKFNNVTKSVSVNSSVTFTGTPGLIAAGTATTNGVYTSGDPLGEIVTIPLNYTFPSLGTISIDINVPPTYFFLFIKNLGVSDITQVTINSGQPGQFNLNTTLKPSTTTKYTFGYFKANTNSNVIAIFNSGTQSVSWTQGTGDFILPFTNNQSVTLTKN